MRRTFHHIGLPTQVPTAGETWIEATRLWLSNPNLHPQRIEWLRYSPDSPVDPGFRASPHIAYTVDDLQEAIAGKEIAVEPGEIGEPPFALAAFTREDGILVEYMQIYEGREWFDDEV